MARRTTGGPIPCGFCGTGNHGSCPSGVRNGNGQIHLCGCTCERAQQKRCTECNTREQNLIGSDWRCIDRDACTAAVKARVNADPTIRRIRAMQAGATRASSVALSAQPRLVLKKRKKVRRAS